MKKYGQIIFVFLSVLCCLNTAYSLTPQKSTAACQASDIPKVIKKLENYDIISSNVSSIATAFAFSGNQLVYSVSAHPKHKINKVTIDSKTGQIRVDAEKRDLFDVFVKVKNSCGSATTKFNVQIDEEE